MLRNLLNKKILNSVIILLLSFVFITGCQNNQINEDIKVEKNIDIKNENKIEKNETNAIKENNNIKKSKENVVKQNKKKIEYISKYTGMLISKEINERIPIMAIVENLRAARPQSGIAYADIVYETLVEGGITRYIALFHSESPVNIGPIRSTRPYLQSLAIPFNVGYAHCGGSYQALNEILKLNLKSMNEMKYGNYFWRYNKRKAPHNLYAKTEELRKLANKKGYNKPNSFNIKFYDLNKVNQNLPDAKNIKIVPSHYTYATFEYKNGKYYRYQEGEKDIDLRTGKQIAVENIVVQIADITYLKNKYKHIDIKLLGKGKGYLFQGGKVQKIIWKRDNINNFTELYDENGNKIKFVKGKTWWYILGKNSKIEYN